MVGPNGEQVGIVRVEDALRLAAEADLDLVEVAPTAKPPVAKLMDFGKYKYEAAVKAREARKNQVNTVIKEVRVRPKIEQHDYDTKLGHLKRFLTGGDKVKITCQLRGREQSRPEIGFRLLQKLAEEVADLGVVESSPRQDGRNQTMVIAPLKKKAEARAEERRRKEVAAKEAEAVRAEAEAGKAAARAARQAAEPSPEIETPAESVAETVVVEPAEQPAPVEPLAAAPVDAPAVEEQVTTPEEQAPHVEQAPPAPEPVTPRPAPTKAAAPRPAPAKVDAPTKAPAKPTGPAKPAAPARPATPRPPAKPAAPKAPAKTAAPKPAAPAAKKTTAKATPAKAAKTAKPAEPVDEK